MTLIVETGGCLVYCGDDLSLAAANSEVSAKSPLRRTRRTPDALSRLLSDARNVRWRELVPRACVIRAPERDSGEILTVGFSGSLRIVDAFAAGVFGHGDYDAEPARLSAIHGVDILISDHALADLPTRFSRPCIRIPPWVRQERPIAADWTETLAGLSSKLRSELRRWIRRQGYTVAISAGDAAIRDYYRELHRPYLSGRFGDAAIVAPESAFVRQRRDALRLDLLRNRSPVAASLLEVHQQRLAIRSSAMHPDAPPLPGRADVLDYFSLLMGQLLDCRTLDFGLSRPHLDNGAFRYKTKWGARPQAVGGLLKADVRVYPLERTEATLAFLRRNRFLQRGEEGLVLRMLYDRAAACRDEDLPEPLGRLTRPAGVERVYDPDELPAPKAETPGVVYRPLRGANDPYRIPGPRR